MVTYGNVLAIATVPKVPHYNELG